MHRTLTLCLWSLTILTSLISIDARSAEGDQFLDGIGETALIARYLFNGNVEDRSRNSFHAALHGQQAAFVDDEQFGKVLSLPGGRMERMFRFPARP